MPIPELSQGSYHTHYALSQELVYNARFANFGTTATIIPLVDPAIGRINATAHNTKVTNASGSDQVLTFATAPSGMGTTFDLMPAPTPNLYAAARLHGHGVPSLKFNGTSERATIPDVAYWTRAATAPFSLVACIMVPNLGANSYVIAKDNGSSAQEWALYFVSDETIRFQIFDQTASANISLASNAAVTQNVPLHIAATYDGGTDMSASVLYVNGASVASTAAASGVFVTMRNTAAVVSIASDSAGTPAQYWSGSIFGWGFGIAFTQTQLTAAQVKNDYDLWRAMMGLG